MKFLSLLALFFLGSFSVLFATGINGRIIDEDGLPLGFASIVVKGTTLGTSANADGYYVLHLPAGKYTLQAQYIGFKQTTFETNISERQTLSHDFVLLAQGYELKDVVIKSGGEDPAYRIIRNAIKKRTFHLKQMQSFQTSIYLKGVFRNRNTPNKVMGIKLKETDKKEMKEGMGLDSAGKGVIYLCEELADYYAVGNKEKLIIKSVKESGDPNGVGMGNVPPVINFYENNVNVFASNDVTFVSPIASGALNSYTYKLIGNFQENDWTIYKIAVTPKRNFERCFTGDIYIADEDWAIHSVRFLLTKKQGLDMLDTIRTEQQYIDLGKDLWVIKSQVYYPTLKLFGFDFSGNFLTVYDNQKVNQPIPDSIFNKRVTVSYQRGAGKKDSAYWQSLRPVKLEGDELRNYDYRDSMHLVETDPKRLDSIRRRNNRVTISDVVMNGVGFTGKSFKTKFTVSPILSDVNYNVVEGLNYSPSLHLTQKLDSGSVLSVTSNLRYGFSNTHFNGKAKINYTRSDKNLAAKNWSLTLAGGQYISQLNNEQPVGEWLNTYSSLLQQVNHFKIYERLFAGALFRKAYGNGLGWNLSALYEIRKPLQNTADYSFVQKRMINPYSDNTPSEFALNPLTKHDAFSVSAMVYFKPGATYTEYPDKKVMHTGNAPLFILSYRKGIPNILNSVTDFDKWQFQIKDEMNLKRWGGLEYNVSFGGFISSKNVQIPDMKHLMGNQYILASSYLQSFQLAPYYLFSNTEKLYAELHVEYLLKGLLTNKIPLLRQAQWYFVLGNNTFYGQSKQYYTEAFIGIDNFGFKIFRMFRFDYIRGWDSYKQNYSGFRVGLKLGSVGFGTSSENECLIF